MVKWEVDSPKAVVMLIHGATEHIKRYDDFAKYLNKNNFSVYGVDNVGHGDETTNGYHHIENKEIFLNRLLDLNFELQSYKLPVYIVGHSMGSITLRNLIMNGNFKYEKLVLTGITNPPMVKVKAGYLLQKIIMIFQKDEHVNRLSNYLTLGVFSILSKIKYKAKNWITSDQVEYQKYLEDEYCDNKFSNKAVEVLLDLTKISLKKENLEILKNSKYLILGGEEDPVSNFGKEVKKLQKKFNDTENIKIYKGMKHEILNEVKKEDVYKDIIQFLKN